GVPLINLVHARGADGQWARRDVRRGAGGGVGRVVGSIGAADRNAAHTHSLGRADVLVRETRAGVGGGEAVTGHPIVREGHRRVGGSVVNLVHARGTDHQRAPGDVRRGRRGGVGGVVGCISAADGDAAHAHGLGCADVFVGK